MGHEIAGEIVSLDDVSQENLEGRVNALETTVEEIRTEIRDFRTATTVSFNARVRTSVTSALASIGVSPRCAARWTRPLADSSTSPI